jgi:hypothetical protein
MEGMAVYYESLLQPGLGRLSWPFYEGAFAAGVAGRRLNGGDLSAFNRDFHGGNAYLVGSQFVRFLVERYGEQRLWKLVEVQARSILFPLWVNVRFWQAYDKSLSTLIDEFADHIAARYRPVARPPHQRVLRPLGYSARYARAADGTEAIIQQDRDAPSRLVVIDPDGRARAEVNLIDIVPPRRLQISAPFITGGLSFTGDARALYFVAVDRDATYQAARLLRFDLPTATLTVVERDLRGTGGSVSPDGRRYVFARADGDRHDLAELDLGTGVLRVLARQPAGAFVAQPRHSPDGRRLVATVFQGGRFGITVFDAATGRRLAQVPTGGALVHDASWADDHRIVYLGAPGKDTGFQVFVHDLVSGSMQRVTDAPFLAFQPQAAGGRTVRFLNRVGWSWTLDEVPLPPRAPPPPSASPPDEAPPAEDPVGPTPALTEATPPSASAAAPTPPTAPPAAAAPVPSVDRAPLVLSDSPYRQWDHIWYPQLRGPVLVLTGRRAEGWGLGVGGGDRLGIHRWSANVSYQSVSNLWSYGVAYANRQLAPLTLILGLSQTSVRDVPPQPDDSNTPPDAEFTLFRPERVASGDLFRSFYGNPVGVGFSLIESYRPDDPEVLFPRQRFAGPQIFATHTSREDTPYTGARRALSASVYGAGYPRAWGSSGYGFLDLRGTAAVTTPLPLSRRHTLTLQARGRALPGVPDEEPLLQVGGNLVDALWRRPDAGEIPDLTSPLLPPGLRFFESLRGFEDYPFLTSHVFIGDATYRYPLIIDWGSASTFGLLPAFFLRQLDLQLFGALAATGEGERHLSVGASLTIQLALWVVPLAPRYQLARRLTDDQALVHLVTVAVDF